MHVSRESFPRVPVKTLSPWWLLTSTEDGSGHFGSAVPGLTAANTTTPQQNQTASVEASDDDGGATATAPLASARADTAEACWRPDSSRSE